ncbi:HlyD family efflux transporter periplasmic adaptor subunit [Poseidonocella sp. HB161398]|uniref:HlyD family efflux transporter periplasmic adaptor subunit n=1 Tax=Poseidonocella sp. HB161398 TaxID=2320855 RepID=UPI0019823E7B|nr:HlyD family efflux transporter periplasmic adaptor subunit [Poseidonocella sp. HB161398]
MVPVDGRVQYLVAREGKVVGAGSRFLMLVPLSDVCMTFVLAAAETGRMQLGGEVRQVLEAAPHCAIPAAVTFIADVAQFTPGSVETQQERVKLMFRVCLRARIPPELPERYGADMKTGLPGMAYLRLEPGLDWPAVATSSPPCAADRGVTGR